MKKLALIVLLAGCNTYPAAEEPEKPTTERTLWQVCWTDDPVLQLPKLPSDRPPHTPQCDNPEPIRWPQLPITVTVAPGAEDTTYFVRRSLWRWNKWLGFVFFEFTPGYSEADVFVTLDREPSGGFWGIARHFKHQGKLRCNVHIFGDGWGPYLERTMTHEFGHVLGLSHEYPKDRSIMTQGAKYYLTRASPGDLAALRELYKIGTNAQGGDR